MKDNKSNREEVRKKDKCNKSNSRKVIGIQITNKETK
jgi:hypothetical protein